MNASPQELDRIRHSCSHVMAQAVMEMFPGTKLGVGPPIEDGFYYDFDCPRRITPEDLPKIEERMRQIISADHPFRRSEKSRPEAREFLKKQDQIYKIQILEAIPEERVSFYQQDSFVDLCEGPHVERTGQIGAFKLLKVAGAYWRGDEKGPQLQRIYGTAWPTEEELQAYLKRLEEAQKRDHRELGPQLGLFQILPDEAGAGLVFWLPKGALIRKIIEDRWRDLHLKEGYQLLYTPHVARLDLWKTSGHLDYFRENMYPALETENQAFQLKPMNCPFHILAYRTRLVSWREMPVRFAELGTVYRWERGGVMHGLMRVRGFTQDDAHIFCRPDQLEDEVVRVLDLMRRFLSLFGFEHYEIRLSTRPEKFDGAPAQWDRAEAALAAALRRAGMAFEPNPGEGVFYGPKIDLRIRDSLGRFWQCSTVQVDFNLPKRFRVTYRDSRGRDVEAMMVHRALMGSLERFFGILIEHYAGAFPLWLAPVQVRVLPVAKRHRERAAEVAGRLRAEGVRAEVDEGGGTVAAGVRRASLEKIPFLAVIGDREIQEGTVAIRRFGRSGTETLPAEEFLRRLKAEIA